MIMTLLLTLYLQTPLCFCIISILQCPSLFNQILEVCISASPSLSLVCSERKQKVIIARYDSTSSLSAVLDLAEKLYEQKFPFIGESIEFIVRSPFTNKYELQTFTYNTDTQASAFSTYSSSVI